MELHFHEIANRLNIATSTAHRIYQQFERTGNVEPMQRKARPELRALDEHNELLVIGIIMENPTLYLEEVSKHILSLNKHHYSTINHLHTTETIWHHKKASQASGIAEKWCIPRNLWKHDDLRAPLQYILSKQHLNQSQTLWIMDKWLSICVTITSVLLLVPYMSVHAWCCELFHWLHVFHYRILHFVILILRDCTTLQQAMPFTQLVDALSA